MRIAGGPAAGSAWLLGSLKRGLADPDIAAWRPGSRTAASAPTATTAAPTQSAGMMPSVKRAADPYPPWCVKIEPAPPRRTRRPARGWHCWRRTPCPPPRADGAEDDGRHRREEERHARRPRWRTGHEVDVGHVGAVIAASHASAVACSARPATSNGARRSGRSPRRRSARRSSACPSTAACAGRPRAASSPARSGGTGSGGRSTRTCRRT